jgi:hypothetical protein
MFSFVFSVILYAYSNSLFCCSEFRYEKLKTGQSAESEEHIPLSSNGDPKYVIIDEFESLDNELES